MLGRDAPGRARMRLREGDVVASKVITSLDKVALVTKEYDGAVGSTGYFVLRPKSIGSGHLLALVRSSIVAEQMICETSGTILSAVSPHRLSNIIVPAVRKEIAERLESLTWEAINRKVQASQLFEHAKEAMTIAVESGELDALRHLGRAR